MYLVVLSDHETYDVVSSSNTSPYMIEITEEEHRSIEENGGDISHLLDKKDAIYLESMVIDSKINLATTELKDLNAMYKADRKELVRRLVIAIICEQHDIVNSITLKLTE